MNGGKIFLQNVIIHVSYIQSTVQKTIKRFEQARDALLFVVIPYFDAVSISVFKVENEPPFIVDANTPIRQALVLKFFQMISWRGLQIPQFCSSVQHPQFP